MIRVLIVENVPPLRDMLVHLVEGTPNADVAAVHASAAEASPWHAQHRAAWDVAIVNAQLPGGGFALMRELAAAGERRIFAIADHVSADVIAMCLQAGASQVFGGAEFGKLADALVAAGEPVPPARP